MNGVKSGSNGTYVWGEGEHKGEKYVGDWSDDMRNGHGTHTYANGDVYIGKWKDDKKHFRGQLTEKATGDVYECSWRDDQI